MLHMGSPSSVSFNNVVTASLNASLASIGACRQSLTIMNVHFIQVHHMYLLLSLRRLGHNASVSPLQTLLLPTPRLSFLQNAEAGHLSPLLRIPHPRDLGAVRGKTKISHQKRSVHVADQERIPLQIQAQEVSLVDGQNATRDLMAPPLIMTATMQMTPMATATPLPPIQFNL
jgi:hypothetical protein